MCNGPRIGKEESKPMKHDNNLKKGQNTQEVTSLKGSGNIKVQSTLTAKNGSKTASQVNTSSNAKPISSLQKGQNPLEVTSLKELAT